MAESNDDKLKHSGLISRRSLVLGSIAAGLSVSNLIYTEKTFADQGFADSADQMTGRTIVDDLGREVTLPDKVERIAVGRPNAQAFILSICPNILTALSYIPNGYETPGIAERLSFSGPLMDRSKEDVEEIVDKNDPDLIIDIGYYNEKAYRRIDELLEMTEIPFISFELSLHNIPRILQNLGRIMNTSRSDGLAEYAEKTISEITSIATNHKGSKPSVLFCTDDLTTRYRYGQRVLQKEVIEAVGCVDAFVINASAVKLNPDYLIVPSEEAVKLAATNKDLRSINWANTTCVKEQNVYAYPSMKGCLNGISSLERYLLGIQWLAKTTKPNFYQFDFEERVDEFIDVFYGPNLDIS